MGHHEKALVCCQCSRLVALCGAPRMTFDEYNLFCWLCESKDFDQHGHIHGFCYPIPNEGQIDMECVVDVIFKPTVNDVSVSLRSLIRDHSVMAVVYLCVVPYCRNSPSTDVASATVCGCFHHPMFYPMSFDIVSLVSVLFQLYSDEMSDNRCQMTAKIQSVYTKEICQQYTVFCPTIG